MGITCASVIMTEIIICLGTTILAIVPDLALALPVISGRASVGRTFGGKIAHPSVLDCSSICLHQRARNAAHIVDRLDG